jgi:Protein of unknown function (DUF2778)
MTWNYEQATGKLTHNTVFVATGYSGSGAGRNNTAMEAIRNIGPIPRGKYSIGVPYNTQTHGPHVMALLPVGHNALGRSEFLIHGDNRSHTASQGCIILGPQIRHRISGSGDKVLEVK